MVFHQYFWIYVFVWARVFCGTRKHQYASVDCSGGIHNIYLWESIEVKVSRMSAKITYFMLRGRRQGSVAVSEPRGLRWRAMLHDHMVRRTCFREEYYTGTRGITQSEKTAGPDPRKLYVNMRWFLINISRYMCSFGLASFVVRTKSVCFHGLQRVHPENPCDK